MPPCGSLSKAAYLAVLNIYYANHRASPVAQQQKKESTCNAGDTRGVGSIPGSGTCPGSMGWTWLKQLRTHAYINLKDIFEWLLPLDMAIA